MVKYFEIHESIDPKIVGVRDGLGQVGIDMDFRVNNQWYVELFGGQDASEDRWRKWMKMPDYGNVLQKLTLYKNAKLTDFIDIAGSLRGYIVSDKLKNVLENLNIPRNKYFEASFIRNKEIISGYWWLLYDLDDGEETVDFSKSEFNFAWHEQQYGKGFRVNTYQEYINLLYETGRAAQAIKLVFNKNFNQSLDMWGTQFLSMRKGYVSQRLLDTFRRQGITGYEKITPRCQLVF